MPNSLDGFPQNNQMTSNPVQRLLVDPMSFLEDNPFGTIGLNVIEGAVNQLLGWIGQTTGINFVPWIEAADDVFDALERLFGDLNPLSGTFNPADAIEALLELAMEEALNAPELLGTIQQFATTGLEHLLIGFITSPGGQSLLTQLVRAMNGITTGANGQAVISDLEAVFGSYDNAFDSLVELFGELNPVSGTFDPGKALVTFVELIIELAEDDAQMLLAVQNLVTTGISEGVSAFLTIDTWTGFLSDAIGALGGTGASILDFAAALLAIPGDNITGTLSNALLDGANLIGNVDAALISGVMALNNIPALTSSWAGTIAGVLINSPIGQNIVPSLTSAWTGSIAGTLISGALANASLAGSAITGTIDATIVSGALTLATIAGSAIDSVLSAAYIPSLTSGWAGTISGSLVNSVLGQSVIPSLTSGWSGSIAGNLVSGALSAATVAGSAITGSISAAIISGALALSNIPALTSSWGGSISGSLINSVLGQSVIPSLTSGWSGSIAGGLVSGALTAATLAGSALTGTVAAGIISGVLSTINIPTITAGMTSGLAAIDTLMTAWGATGSGFSSANLFAQAQNIPHEVVQGLLGATTVGNTIQNFLDNSIQAVQQDVSLVNKSIAQWAGTLGNLSTFLGFVSAGAAPQNSVAQIASQASDNLATRAAQKTIAANLESSIDAVFDIVPDIGSSGSTLPTIAVTQGTTRIGYVTIRDGGIKESIQWLGYGITNVTSMVISICSVDATGASTKVYTSPNIIGAVSSGSVPAWTSLNLAALNYLDTSQGQVYAIEMATEGTGTYNLVGKTLNGQLPSHLSAKPALPGATRGYQQVAFDVAGSGADVGIPVVAYDSGGVGAPLVAQGVFTSWSWTHNIPSTSNLLIVSATYGQSNTVTLTPTCGGVAMTPLTTYMGIGNFGGIAYFHQYFYLFNPPTGNQTIQMSGTGNITYGAATSSSYRNVGSIGTLSNSVLNSTSISQSNTGNAGGVLVNSLAAITPATAATWSAYSQTQVYNASSPASTTYGFALDHGYSTATGTVAFSGTISPAAASYLIASTLPLLSGAPTVTPTVDSTGSGYGTGGSASYQQYIDPKANAIIIALYTNSAGSQYCDVGGVQSTWIGTNVTVSGDILNLHYVLNPPTGWQTITGYTYGNNASRISVASASYFNVASVALTGTNSGTSTTATQTITGAANNLYVQALGGTFTTGSFSAYSKTSRGNIAGSTSAQRGLLLGDFTGTGSLTGSATVPSSTAWGSMVVTLAGSKQTLSGSCTINPTAGSTVIVYAGISQTTGTTSMCAYYDGVPMIAQQIPYSNSSTVTLQQFVAYNVSGGTKTVTVYGTGNAGVSLSTLTFNALAYKNVQNVQPATYATAASTSWAHTATGMTSGLVSQCFYGNNGATSTSVPASYNQTSRYSHSAASAYDGPMVMGDSATVGSVSFTATAPGGGFLSLASVLSPIPAPHFSTLGTGFHQSSPTSQANASWTHVAAAGDTILAFATIATNNSGSLASYASFTFSGTCGGQAMTFIGGYNGNNTVGEFTVGFYIKNVAAGSKTINITSTGGSGTMNGIVANSAGYQNVDSIGALQTAGGAPGAGATSTSVTNVPMGELIVVGGGGYIAGNGSMYVTVANTNATVQRYHGMAAGSSNMTVSGLIADVPATVGTTTTLFNYSDSVTGSYVSQLAVHLIPTDTSLPTTMPEPAAGRIAQYSALTPWFGVSGSAGITQYTPIIVSFPASGTFDPTLYSWANYFDRITCGGAGGGSGGNINGVGGGTGYAGAWNQDTITKAQAGTSLWTITDGAGGAGGAAYSNAGGAGGNSSIVTPGYSTLIASGGAGAPFGTGSPSGYGVAPAPGPGNLTYTDAHGDPVTIPGGAGGGVASGGGYQPGGAGAGGNSTFVGGGGTTGGYGAPGESFIRIYQ